MHRFRYLISKHETISNSLRARVKETFDRREASHLAWRDWELAGKRCREYRSEVDDMLETIFHQGLEGSTELRLFAFCFVQEDPYYFRSGYALEKLIRKIKKLTLSNSEKKILQELLLKRMDTKALRNYRQICRMIPVIETDDFRDQVVRRLRSKDPNVVHRAAFALTYFSKGHVEDVVKKAN